MNSKRAIVSLAALLAASPALAQQAILQGGPWVPGHMPQYVNSGMSQPIVQDAGSAGGGGQGANPSELGLTIRSPTNTYPAANAGNGPAFTNLCDFDAPTTNPGGYHYICLGPNSNGASVLAVGTVGSATQFPLQFLINGTPATLGNLNAITAGLTTVSGCPSNGIIYNSAGAVGCSTTLPVGTQVPFTQNGTGVVASNLNTRSLQTPLYATDFMTANQIADGSSRTDSIDVSGAINACIAAAFAAGKNCYLPSGKWRASGAQLVMDYGGTLSNGVTFYGDGPGATQIDLQLNTANPPFIVEASGGSSGSPVSAVYGGARDFGLLARVAGPVFQDGQNDFSDFMNQQVFANIEIQNFNNTSSSTCYRFNAVYSGNGTSLNCSTSAGNTGGNDLFQFEKVSFGFWNLGGSNGQNFLHITNDVTTGNVFAAQDCEVVGVCVKIDTANGVDNSWYGGTWAYSVNGVLESLGGNNHAFVPNINANASNFLSSGSVGLFELWNNSTIAPLFSPAFTGAIELFNTSIVSTLSLVSGAFTGQITEDTSGDLVVSNASSGQFITIQQAGAGTIQEKVNTVDVHDQTQTLNTFKTHIASIGSIPTCGSGCSTISANGTDVKFALNTSAAVTAATANFSATWTGLPVCVATSNDTAAFPAITSLSTSAITVSFASSATATVYVHCIQ